MEKLIDQIPYNTADFIEIASWDSLQISETLYFADNGEFLLHCIGTAAEMTNSYGTKSFANEDLIILEEDDVRGWLKVHAEKSYDELFGEEQFARSA